MRSDPRTRQGRPQGTPSDAAFLTVGQHLPHQIVAVCPVWGESDRIEFAAGWFSPRRFLRSDRRSARAGLRCSHPATPPYVGIPCKDIPSQKPLLRILPCASSPFHSYKPIYLGNDFGMEIFAMQGIWGKRSISKKNVTRARWLLWPTNFTLSLAFSFPAPRQLSGNFYDPLHFPVFSSAFLLFIHSSNSRCPSSDW